MANISNLCPSFCKARDTWDFSSIQISRENLAFAIEEIVSYGLKVPHYILDYSQRIAYTFVPIKEDTMFHYLYRQAAKIVVYTAQFFFFLSLMCPLAFFVVPSSLLRILASCIQPNPFLYAEPEGVQTQTLFKKRELSLLFWNVQSDSEGILEPWSHRFEGVVDLVRAEDSDVVCLYEVQDIGVDLRNALVSLGYHVYYKFGLFPGCLGKGMLLASRYPMSNPQFTEFPFDGKNQRERLGQGIFSVDVLNEETTKIATLYSAVVPTIYPNECFCNDKEWIERDIVRQLREWTTDLQNISDRLVIVVGNLLGTLFGHLNQDGRELCMSENGNRFSTLIDEEESSNENADSKIRVLLLNNGTATIETTRSNQVEALSSYRPIKAKITLARHEET